MEERFEAHVPSHNGHDTSCSGDKLSQTKFCIVPQWLIKHPAVSHYGIAVYAALAMYANEDGACFPSVKTLQGHIKCGEKAVRQGISEITEAGALKSTPRYKDDGSRTSNHYTLLTDPSFLRQVPPLPQEGTPPSTGRSNYTQSNYNQLTNNLELEKMMVALKGLYPRRPGDTHRWQQVKKKIAGKGKDWEQMLVGVKNYALRVSDPQFVMNAGKFFEKEVWRDYLEEQESSDPEVRRLRELANKVRVKQKDEEGLDR